MADKRAKAEEDVAKLFGQPMAKQQKLSFTKLSSEAKARKTAEASKTFKEAKEKEEGKSKERQEAI